METEKEPNLFELEKLEEEISNDNYLVNLSDHVSVYLKDIGLVKLLTRDEEIELARLVSEARYSTDSRVIELGKEANDKLVESNLRLVVSIAKKFKFQNIPLMDLIQEGNMGLMKAVERYEVDRGFKFSTYATWWIRQSISRFISNHSKTIRIPVHVYDSISKVKRVKRDYTNEHGKEPNTETISKISGISISTLRFIDFYIDDIISLDNLLGDGISTLNDSTKDTNNPNPEEYNKIQELEEYVNEVLEVLSDREKTIVKLRYGIDCDARTLKEIGSMLDLSRERVRQIEQKALKKLKKSIVV